MTALDRTYCSLVLKQRFVFWIELRKVALMAYLNLLLHSFLMGRTEITQNLNQGNR
jgi:hypothetical protein